MRTNKQIKAAKRNFALMYLTGVTIVLEKITKTTRKLCYKRAD